MKRLKRIKLGKKKTLIAPKTKSDSVSYPSIYISNKKLPIGPEDVGKMLSANVKLKVTGVNMKTDIDNQNFNYDFEVREITFINNAKI